MRNNAHFCRMRSKDRSRACPPEGPADNFKLFLGKGLERAELLFEEKNELCYKAPHPPPPPCDNTYQSTARRALGDTHRRQTPHSDPAHVCSMCSCFLTNPQLKPVHQVHQVSSWCPGSLQHGIHGIHTSTSRVTRRHLHTTHIITAETLQRLHSLVFCLLSDAAACLGPNIVGHRLCARACAEAPGM